MTSKANTKPLAFGTVFQERLEAGLADFPVVLLETQISKKLKEQGIRPPRGFAREVAEHVMSGSTEPIISKRRVSGRTVNLIIDDSDLNEVLVAFERFQEEKFPSFLSSLADKMAKSMLKDLKSRWPDEQALQQVDLAGFRERMEYRWGKPLAELRMLLTMSREWCGNITARESSKTDINNPRTRKVLYQLIARAFQVTEEIICLLENGFADGAMARWRTLHELAVVATVLQRYGDDLSKRYLDHQHVESKRAMDKYLECAPVLGYKPLSKRARAKIEKGYNRVIETYGKQFGGEYGWARFHINIKQKSTFAHLEAVAGRAEMRSHYQMGNDNIHAGIKSMYFRLGLTLDSDRLLAGRSNVGLSEPGQNAALTLTQLVVLVCLSEPVLDDNVIAGMLIEVRNQIPRSFADIELEIKKEEKSFVVDT